MKIRSVANPRIRRIRSLRRPAARREQGVTIVEGLREWTRVREAGGRIEELYLCPDLTAPGAAGLEGMPADAVFEVTPAVYERIAYGDRREGILAVVRVPQGRLTDLPRDPRPLFVVIDGVEKPGNLGAVLRTCEAVGVRGLIVTGAGCDVWSPNVVRASLGAVFAVPVVVADAEETVSFLRERDVPIIAAVPGAGEIYWEGDLKGPSAFVLGNEQRGVGAFWTERAQRCVSIPQRGRGDSLNVSVAAAVLLYESLRQRELEDGG